MRRFLGVLFIVIGGWFLFGVIYNVITPKSDMDVNVPLWLISTLAAGAFFVGIWFLRIANQ